MKRENLRLQHIEENLERRLSAVPEELRPVMAYSLLGSGKRVRATLLHLVAAMAALLPEQAEPYASALEMIHAYSLIHDDLPAMDNDDMRRGKASCHRAFSEGMAILAGDALLNTAAEILMEAAAAGANALSASVYMLRMAGTQGMILGQALDLEQTGKTAADSAFLRRMQVGKTAALLSAAIVCPLLRAGRPETDIVIFRALAEAVGVAFQIQDDLLDDDPESELGKTKGKDKRDGKLTSLSLYGREGSVHLLEEEEAKIRAALLEAEKRGYLIEELASYLQKLAVRKK